MPAADGGVSTATCFHCGETAAVPIWHVLSGQQRAFCCSGCAGAAQWIGESGLFDYYRLRQRDSARVDAQTLAMDYAVWDRSDLQAAHVTETPEGRVITLAVDGMHCAACAWLIDKALRQQQGVRDVQANAVTGRVRVVWDAHMLALSTVLQRLAALGYRPSLAGSSAQESLREKARRDMLLRLGVAGLGAMQAMMFSEALYLDTQGTMPLPTRDMFRWLTALVSAPVVFYAGMPFLRGMWRELRLRLPGMDTLIGSGVLLAWGASLIETLRGGPQVWFDAAVMFVLFLLAARYLEEAARNSARARLDALAGAQPALAWREQGDGLAQVPLVDVAEGDVLQVPAGSTVPADGVLLDHAAAFDEALLTGEFSERPRAPGDTVLAGSVVHEATARLRVTAVGAATRLSELVRRVEHAQSLRPATQQFAERLARKVVIATLLLSVLTALAWLWIDAAMAFPVALAVLVATCPCALALALPAAQARANTVLAERGALVLGAEALERLAEVDTIAFDKTGTLTRGQPELVSTETFGALSADAARRCAAALEHAVAHPLAAAFGSCEGAYAQQVRTVVGEGVEGQFDGALWRIGRASFAVPQLKEAREGVWLSREGVAVARFTIDDGLRPETALTVGLLQADGYRLLLLSGDSPARVESLAEALGLAERHALLRPSDKVEHVRALQSQGRRVLMVGDGLNDAAVLSAASVSMAMANGAPLAQRSADIVLGSSGLFGVRDTLKIALQTRRIIRQNLRWAVAYNLVVLPIAAMGWMTPGWAALGMALSSLGVTLNALRIGRGHA